MLGNSVISESAIGAIPDRYQITFVVGLTAEAFLTSRLADPYVDFVSSIQLDRIYTVEITSRKTGNNVASVIYAASQEFVSRPTDSPASTHFKGTLTQSLTMDRTIIGGTTGFNQLSTSWGDVEIMNVEADYDYLIADNYAMDGRDVAMRVGAPTSVYNRFYPMARLSASTYEVTENALIVSLRDKGYLLEVPIQENVYQGTGGVEGNEDLAGKRKPLCFGQIENVRPALLIPGEGLFQVHDGAVNAITGVYDRGYPLTATGANYATPALLRAATIAEGHFATCTAFGMFRLGSLAFGEVTADVRGDTRAPDGYIVKTSDLARRLVGTYTDVKDDEDLDVSSFNDLSILQPAPIGYFVETGQEASVAQVVQDLMEGIGGWSGFTRLNKLQLGVFREPTGSAVRDYDSIDILEISRERLPGNLYPPPWRQRVAWRRNWTIITNPAEALANRDPSRRSWLGRQFNLAVTDPARGDEIYADHLLAQDPAPVESYFVNEADAKAEADRLLDLYTQGFGLYRIKVKDHAFIVDIGQVIRVNYPRWNLAGGRLLRIVAVREQLDTREIELRAFG